ncbi:MAG: ABC transporter ATP-binding protein [Acidimicrobiales bacterium]
MSEVALRTDHLSKHYGHVIALKDLNLEISVGQVVGYLGPNGAGKTTTIRLLLGLARPTSGWARVFGIDCQRRPVDAHRRMACVLSDATLWPRLTGAESLDLLGELHGSVDVAYRAELIERFNLDPSKKVRTYSGGNRQKVLLVAALMTRADLLLLDEPTTGLDPLMEEEFRGCIREAKERGQTILLSSHVLSEVEATCDRVAILRDGMLVEMGTLAAMRHLGSVLVEASFDGDVPDVNGVDGVSSVVVEDHVLRCQVRGSVEPLLQALAKAGTRRLLSREPSLEELFLAHYGDGTVDRRQSGDAG